MKSDSTGVLVMFGEIGSLLKRLSRYIEFEIPVYEENLDNLECALSFLLAQFERLDIEIKHGGIDIELNRDDLQTLNQDLLLFLEDASHHVEYLKSECKAQLKKSHKAIKAYISN